MKSGKILVCALIGLALIHSSPVLAGDELSLCGIVKNIDPKTNTLSINIKTESCPGMIKFKLADARLLDSFKMEKNICFQIDDSRCRTGYIYNIIRVDDVMAPKDRPILPANNGIKR
jgi:hypothetical protein